MAITTREIVIERGELRLEGMLGVPDGATGIVLFAHGSGSSRFSSRNQHVATALRRRGFGTLLFDLLTEHEEAIEATTRHLRFDIELLGGRLVHATDWLLESGLAPPLPIGYFGASTGAAAALVAATLRPDVVRAVVSRGGRPDLAGDALERVRVPTLLVVGSRDEEVLDLNTQATEHINAVVSIETIAGATHLFSEPGTLDQAADLAGTWFERHLDAETREVGDEPPRRFARRRDPNDQRFEDRLEAGERLAMRVREELPDSVLAEAVVIGLPRGGVPVAWVLAQTLDVPLDVVFVRKLGAISQPEYAIGAIGEDGASIVDEQAARLTGTTDDVLERIIERELATIARYRARFDQVRRVQDLRGRHVIVVDDGIATGMTAMAAARSLCGRGALSVTLAVPVCAPQSRDELRRQFDDVIYVQSPSDFRAVGSWYRQFDATTDDEVALILEQAASAEEQRGPKE